MFKPGCCPRGQYGLEAKFCGLGLGLMGFGLGLVLGLMKHWPRSRVYWRRGLNKLLCDTLNENKHVSGSKICCQLNQFSSCQRITN